MHVFDSFNDRSNQKNAEKALWLRDKPQKNEKLSSPR
jgi:hypothetical protein